MSTPISATAFSKTPLLALGQLVSAIDDNDTTITLYAGQGANFGAEGDVVWARIATGRTLSELQAGETVQCTVGTDDEITIVRDSVEPREHPADSYLYAVLLPEHFQDEIHPAINALEVHAALVEGFIADLMGGGDGIIRNGITPETNTALKVVQTSPVSMKVTVKAGRAIISKRFFDLPEDWESGTITAPVTNPRIDLVQLVLATGLPAIKTGSENVSPVKPTPDANCLEAGSIALAVSQTDIETADITDGRTYL